MPGWNGWDHYGFIPVSFRIALISTSLRVMSNCFREPSGGALWLALIVVITCALLSAGISSVCGCVCLTVLLGARCELAHNSTQIFDMKVPRRRFPDPCRIA
jgi:hypothetical protein